MIEYFEQSILHDYDAAFENYRIICKKLCLRFLFADRKTAAQSRRVKRGRHNSIFLNILLCGPRLAYLYCAAIFRPQNAFGVVRITGYEVCGFRDLLEVLLFADAGKCIRFTSRPYEGRPRSNYY
jgi:hypothetical protein